MRTVKFYTLGCKVNQYETQSIRERFLSRGFQEMNNGQKADFYLVNTCTVTSKADRDSRHFILKARRENPKAKIMVTGCLIERDAHSVVKLKGVFLVRKKFFPDGISGFCGHTRAFLKIQDGCSNSCSYCKVPLVRGESRSRRLKEIAQEAKLLVKNGFTPLETKSKQEKDRMSLTGFKEIVLTGICLGAYGRDLKPKINLVKVIEELEKIDGLLRLRLSSIEAGDVSDALINKMSGSQKFCRHLHIPIQSGDDEILRKMDRHYSRQDYLNLINRIKAQIPPIAITTDVLVGFPAETEANFQNTLDLVKEVQPLKVHIFPYSRREGTSAAQNCRDEVNPLIIKERISRLKNIAESCALQYKKHFLGQKMDVLIEGRSKENPLFWEGYTDNYLKVIVASGGNLKNQLIPLALKEIRGDFILADLS